MNMTAAPQANATLGSGSSNAIQFRYEHDCDCCKPLGIFGKFDLYFCSQPATEKTPTVIARFGKDGDYSSGLIFADFSPELGEAKRRAIAAGLLTV